MKILFMAPEPFFELRGTPINVKHMLEAIGGAGNHVDLLTYHVGKNISLKNVKIHRIPNVPFVRYVPIGPSYTKVVLDCVLFLKALKMVLTCRYDCIHAVEESVFIAFLLGKFFRIPFIYDMDSCISHQLAYTGKLKNKPTLKLIKLFEDIVVRNSIAVVTVCSAFTELVVSTAPGKKVFQIEDCPVEFADGKTYLTREKVGIGEGDVIIMYVGNLESYQGVEMLLESFSLVLKAGTGSRSVKLVLVGGEPRQIQQLKLLAARLGILDSVLFHGKRPVEEIPSLLGVADILVSPRLEGTNTPMKIFDYLASGKAVVATDLPMHSQVLNDKFARLAEPDAEHFSEAILELIRDGALRYRLGEEGKRIIESRYSRSSFKEKVRKVYEFIEK